MKVWQALLCIVTFVVAMGGVIVLGIWLEARQAKSPHCVCSQQTCFPAPDGGWRK